MTDFYLMMIEKEPSGAFCDYDELDLKRDVVL